jgi:hypothetical protein
VAAVVYYVPVLVLAAGLITAFLMLRRWLRTPRLDPRRAGPPRAGPPQLSAAQRRAVARAVARLREEEPG